MKIGIAAATSFEIQPTMDHLQALRSTSVPPDIDIILTGIGSMLSAYEITRYIISQRPAFMIQAGIGGSFSERFSPGDVVVIGKEAMGDLGVHEANRFRDIFDLGFMAPSQWPFVQRALENPHLAGGSIGSLATANGLTVNEITTDPLRIKLLKESHQCDIESMEGASFHYVCLRENLPFIQLRAVSNEVGERDKTKWALKKAIENLNIELLTLLQTLS